MSQNLSVVNLKGYVFERLPKIEPPLTIIQYRAKTSKLFQIEQFLTNSEISIKELKI